MDEFTALFSRKDMTFEEAVAYFKERVPVTASRFYQIAAEYRTLAFTVSGYMEDDHTVTALATGASVAGTVIRVDDEGVAVECGGYIPAAAAAGVGG